MGVAGGSKGKMCVCNREVGVVGVAGGSKGKMCVCNREGGVVGVGMTAIPKIQVQYL